MNEQKENLDYFLKTAPIMFGRYWKTNVARYFQRAQNTVSNWRNSKTPVPSTIIELIRLYSEKGGRYDPATNTIKITKNAKKTKS